jgi:O-antigen ligase
MAAETGLLGLGAFLWIMITLFKNSLADLKKINNRSYNSILIGLLAGLFAFLVHSFVDTNLFSLKLRYLMWFAIGLIVALRRIALKEESDSREYNA